VAGIRSDIETRYGMLFDTLMHVGRESANWGSWQSLYT